KLIVSNLERRGLGCAAVNSRAQICKPTAHRHPRMFGSAVWPQKAKGKDGRHKRHSYDYFVHHSLHNMSASNYARSSTLLTSMIRTAFFGIRSSSASR